MHLGLLGGIGPAATIAYYRRLVSALEAEGRPLHATIAHADIASGLARLAKGDVAGEIESHAAHIRRLADAGAEVAVITSLSAHMMEAPIARAVPIPVCSILTALSDHVCRTGLRRIGVIGSLWAMESGMDGALAPAETLVPEDAETRSRIGRAYLDMAVRRHATSDDLALFHGAARDLVERRGAEAVLLGGTDLCLAFDGAEPGIPVIDPVALHVAALVPVALA